MSVLCGQPYPFIDPIVSAFLLLLVYVPNCSLNVLPLFSFYKQKGEVLIIKTCACQFQQVLWHRRIEEWRKVTCIARELVKGGQRNVSERRKTSSYKDTDIWEHSILGAYKSRILLGSVQFRTNQFVLKMDRNKTKLGTSFVLCLGVQILVYRIVSKVCRVTQVAYPFCEHCSPSPVVPHRLSVPV